MIRALVFIATLGFMISFGVLTCNHSDTKSDDPANHPPSLHEQQDINLSLLSIAGDDADSELSVE